MKTEKEVEKELEDCNSLWQEWQNKLHIAIINNDHDTYEKAVVWTGFYAIKSGTLRWVLDEGI
jgi:hypothetical protein